MAFIALAVGLGAVFARLGIWQLDRLQERRAANARVERRLSLPPAPLASLAGDAERVNRRAFVEGTPDHPNEFVLTGRSRNGSPGVHVITPVRVPGSDTAVLVNRGWIYAPDAATADLRPWREARTRFTGYTQEFVAGAISGVQERGMRRLARDGVRRVVPYPVHEVYLVAQDSAGPNAPARLPPPALDEGPHLSYAVQWFAFAAIAIVGAAVVTLRTRRSGHAGAAGA